MADENLVERVLNAKNFGECLENWQKCRLDDVLAYEFDQKLIFTKPIRQANEQVTVFENLWFAKRYSDEDRKLYSKQALTDFLKYRLAPKRKQLEKSLITADLLRSIGGLALFSAATGGLFLVPPAYFAGALIGWLGIGGLGYLNLHMLRKRRRASFAQNHKITMKDIQLFHQAKNFDVQPFWQKYQEHFTDKIREYDRQLKDYNP